MSERKIHIVSQRQVILECSLLHLRQSQDGRPIILVEPILAKQRLQHIVGCQSHIIVLLSALK